MGRIHRIDRRARPVRLASGDDAMPEAQRDPDPAEAIPSLGMIGLNQFEPYLLNRISARYNANMNEKLRQLGLTIAKLRTLAVLSVQQPLTINELSVLAVVDQSTMSRTLDQMEAQRLITRTVREDDMRSRDISITPEGRQTFAEFWPVMHGEYETLFSGVSAPERTVFLTVLHKLLANIRQHQI